MSTILANGLVIGAIYGLVALGIGLTYKKSRVLNFAYGEIGMFGAFVFYSLRVEHHLPYLLALIVGVVVSSVLGAITFAVLLRRRSDPLNMLVGTLAVGGVLVFIASNIWGTDQLYVPAPLADATLHVFGLRFVGARLLVLIVGIALAVAFFLVFRLTSLGLLFRASATDPYAATLIGINVVGLDVVTWAVAGALSGVAAILLAPLVGFDVFFMTLLSIRGFAAALLAGLSNVGGCLVAGLGIGIAEAALTRATTQPGVPEATLVLLMMLVLLLRPQTAERGVA
jgi:branched-chain amino acid transport system permease protein